MELAIDTSTRYAGVAISREGNTLVELSWLSERNHSVELLPSIQRLMDRVGITPADLDCVIVARGPGSFSALRVGMATARGLATAQDTPLVGVGTLEVEAFPYLGTGLPVCAVIEAGRGQVAAAVYGKEQEAENHVPEIMLTTLEDLVESMEGRSLFCGEGAQALAAQVAERYGNRVSVVGAPPPSRRPGVLAYLGFRRLKLGFTDDLVTVEPIYLRGPSITMPRDRQVKS